MQSEDSQASISERGVDIKFGLNYLNIVKNSKKELSIKSRSDTSEVRLDSQGNRVIDDFSEDSQVEDDEQDEQSHSTFKSSDHNQSIDSDGPQNERLNTVNEEENEDGATRKNTLQKKKEQEILGDN